jgi:hypothetical protein
LVLAKISVHEQTKQSFAIDYDQSKSFQGAAGVLSYHWYRMYRNLLFKLMLGCSKICIKQFDEDAYSFITPVTFGRSTKTTIAMMPAIKPNSVANDPVLFVKNEAASLKTWSGIKP